MKLSNGKIYQDRLAREGGEVVFGLTLIHQERKWTAWNNTHFDEKPFCILPNTHRVCTLKA